MEIQNTKKKKQQKTKNPQKSPKNEKLRKKFSRFCVHHHLHYSNIYEYSKIYCIKNFHISLLIFASQTNQKYFCE